MDFVGIEEVKKKIKNLRTVFTRELRKVEASKRSGAGVDDIYVPKFKFFKSMMFLQPHINGKDSKTNMARIKN